MFLTEPLLPTEASVSFINGLFCSGPVDPWKLGSTGFILLGQEVPDNDWAGSGLQYTLDWGGRQWTLAFDEADPGLRSETAEWSSNLLSLHGLAATGRCATEVFTPATLVSVERYRARVQAVFAPPGWAGLTVRAAWSPSCAGAGVDLEVQASASSVGQLRAVELIVQSVWRPAEEPDLPPEMDRWVDARDARSAALSYDGRETDVNLSRLNTNRLAGWRGPNAFVPPGSETGVYHVEMVQPNDVARQIRLEPGDPILPLLDRLVLQYALFGHDIEKGVIFRGRLRACWLGVHNYAPDATPLYEQFVSEPLPLGP